MGELSHARYLRRAIIDLVFHSFLALTDGNLQDLHRIVGFRSFTMQFSLELAVSHHDIRCICLLITCIIMIMFDDAIM